MPRGNYGAAYARAPSNSDHEVQCDLAALARNGRDPPLVASVCIDPGFNGVPGNDQGGPQKINDATP